MRAHKYSRSRVVNRWTVLTLVTVLALLLSACCKKEEAKVYNVGVLVGLPFVADIVDGFKEGMTELGYVEGENIVYDVQATEFDMAIYRSTLDQFVADEVDLILVFPTEATIEAKAATAGTDIPVLFNFVLIEGMDIVNSIREPGGNITGVRYPGPDIAIKRFEIMQELTPEATRMLVPYQKGYPIVGPQIEALLPVAEAAGVTLIEAPAADAAELDAILQTHVQPDGVDIDAIFFVAEPLAVTPEPFAVMGKFAYEHNIPIGGVLMEADGYESIFGVNVNSFDSGKLAAPLAHKIFEGTPPSEIPVISADNFIQVNYKAAQVMGLTVPEGLLSEADEVIR